MKLFRMAALAAAACICFISCEAEGGLSSLKERIDVLEKANIPLMAEQMNAMQGSMSTLLTTQNILLEYIKDLQENVDDLGDGITPDMAEVYKKISSLEKTVGSFSDAVTSIQDFISNKAASQDWVKGTFATLDQYSKLQETISSIKSEVSQISESMKGIDSKIEAKVAEALAQSESSIKSWVNEKLKGYYTIAEIDAKLSALGGGTGGSSTTSQEAETLRKEIAAAKDAITRAYQEAIEEAITKNNGVIDGKIASKISEANEKLNTTIAGIKKDIEALEARIRTLEAQVADLLSRVQSITAIPEYSDGSVGISSSTKDIRFEIYPLEVAQKLAEAGTSVLNLSAVYTQTKATAGQFVSLTLTACSYADGIFTVKANGAKLGEEFFNGTVGASARLLVSKGGVSATSSYFTLTPEK